MTRGRSLELYFVDGRPDGMLTAEVFNWTGHVLKIPRITLPEGLKRPEARQTGVYILLGTDDDGPLAYIGETQDMADRIRDHAAKKDWWETAILITAAGDALHKAHVKYLESRLVERAREAGAMRLENGNTPPRASLNEAGISNMEGYLDVLHMVLPAIGVDLFRSGVRHSDRREDGQAELTPQFHLSLSKENISAMAELKGDEWIVKAGSGIRFEWIAQRHDYKTIYDALFEGGVAVRHADTARFVEDFAFSSPSAAASVISGRSANGRTAWRTKSGKTYAEWEAQQLLDLLKGDA